MRRKPILLLTSRHRRIQKIIFSSKTNCKPEVHIDLFKRYKALIAEREQSLVRKSFLTNREMTEMTGGNATAVATGWMNTTIKFLTQMEREIEGAGIALKNDSSADNEAWKGSRKAGNSVVNVEDLMSPDRTFNSRRRRAFYMWQQQVEFERRRATQKRVKKYKGRRPRRSSSIPTGSDDAKETLLVSVPKEAKKKRLPPTHAQRAKRRERMRKLKATPAARTYRAYHYRTHPAGEEALAQQQPRPGAFARRRLSSRDLCLSEEKRQLDAIPGTSTAPAKVGARRRRRVAPIRRVYRTFFRVRRIHWRDSETQREWEKGKSAWEDMFDEEKEDRGGHGVREVREGDGKRIAGERVGVHEDERQRQRAGKWVLRSVRGYVEGERVRPRRSSRA